MGRTAFVMAVVLWAAGARGDPSPSVVVRQRLAPRTVPVEHALAAAATADSVWVSHETAPRVALLPPDLARRFRDLLLRPERVNPGWDPPEICTECADQLIVYIGIPTLATYSPHLWIQLYFREAQARYKTLDGWVGWTSIRPDGADLLALVKQALPADSVVQSYRWSPRPDSLEPPYPYLEQQDLPQAIVKVPPAYPDSARLAHVQGTVLVEAVVDESGRVVDTRILKSVPMLDEAAAAAVRKWSFKPAMKAGRPVQVRVTIPVKFTLH